jgi:hypothetical protein
MKDSVSLAQFQVYGKLGFDKTVISLKRIRGLMKWMRKAFHKVEQQQQAGGHQEPHHLCWEPEDDDVNWLTLLCLQGPCNKNKGKNTTLLLSYDLGPPLLARDCRKACYTERRKAKKAGREIAIVAVRWWGEVVLEPSKMTAKKHGRLPIYSHYGRDPLQYSDHSPAFCTEFQHLADKSSLFLSGSYLEDYSFSQFS